jgi:copper chaperone
MATEISNMIVNGMSCSHCENSIKKSVEALNGVSGVRVDLENERVSVEYDPEKINMDTIIQTIEGQGYDVVK